MIEMHTWHYGTIYNRTEVQKYCLIENYEKGIQNGGNDGEV